jgi:hypothetical protein
MSRMPAARQLLVVGLSATVLLLGAGAARADSDNCAGVLSEAHAQVGARNDAQAEVIACAQSVGAPVGEILSTLAHESGTVCECCIIAAELCVETCGGCPATAVCPSACE